MDASAVAVAAESWACSRRWSWVRLERGLPAATSGERLSARGPSAVAEALALQRLAPDDLPLLLRRLYQYDSRDTAAVSALRPDGHPTAEYVE